MDKTAWNFKFQKSCVFLSENLFIYLTLYNWALYIKNLHELDIYIYIYTNLPVNAIVTLLHPRSGDSQAQETFLVPSADKQTCKYDTRVLKPPSLPINPKVKGIEP